MYRNRNKYVPLSHVKELLRLYEERDAFREWTDGYEKFDKKINKTIEFIERNAKEFSKGEIK
jgi:hypothetical protein